MLLTFSFLLLIFLKSVDARSKVGTRCPGRCNVVPSASWKGSFEKNSVFDFEGYALNIKRKSLFIVAADGLPLLHLAVRPFRFQVTLYRMINGRIKLIQAIRTRNVGPGKYINLRFINYGNEVKFYLNKESMVKAERFLSGSIDKFWWGGFANISYTNTSLPDRCMATIHPCGTTGKTRDVPGSYCLRYSQNKIVGGINARAGAHPWQVAIRDKQIIHGSHPHKCGGILIHSCWVLTAAHCFGTLNPEEKFIVRVGDYSNVNDKRFIQFENSQDINIEKIIKHKDYFTGLTTRNDIALVKLKKKSGTCAILGAFVKPVCLPIRESNFTTEMKTCVISGWGATESDQNVRDYPICLQSAEVKLISNTDCETHYPDRIYDRMVCAEGTDRNGRLSDACQGDSGGPLVCEFQEKHYAWGITSWGEGCGSKPGVYTKIVEFYHWIEERLAEECLSDFFEH